ncbi:MAG: amidohydrolase family protein [Armatimonadetes bacterium]|nr:amidohydrolase family protein [Armatimonadota bacterium]
MRASWLLPEGNEGAGRWVPADVNFDSGTVALLDAESEPPYLVPALVDCHCHGVDGLDVMDGEGAAVGARLRSLGVEWFLPTTITAAWGQLRSALMPLRSGFPGFAGVHLEGPFINPKRAGAQPKDAVQEPSIEALERGLGDLMDLVRIVTLAPEMPGGLELTAALAQRGVRVSAGHTDADCETLIRAKEAGLSRMTHFYNAMRPFHHRDLGSVGFGLANEITCELIYDRQHVCPEAARLLWERRGPRGVVGISDGTALSGAPDGKQTEMWGHTVVKRDGCVRLQDGTLAGSCVTMADVFRNLWQDIGPAGAVLACSLNPRADLGLPEAALWLVVNEEGEITETLEGNLARRR